jgi:hypothetical protein
MQRLNNTASQYVLHILYTYYTHSQDESDRLPCIGRRCPMSYSDNEIICNYLNFSIAVLKPRFFAHTTIRSSLTAIPCQCVITKKASLTPPCHNVLHPYHSLDISCLCVPVRFLPLLADGSARCGAKSKE